jgi:hypothetical protein
MTSAFQQFEVSLTDGVTRLSNLNDRPSRGMAVPVAGEPAKQMRRFEDGVRLVIGEAVAGSDDQVDGV